MDDYEMGMLERMRYEAMQEAQMQGLSALGQFGMTEPARVEEKTTKLLLLLENDE